MQLDPSIYQPDECVALERLSEKLEKENVNPPESVWKVYHTHKQLALIRFLKACNYDVDKAFVKIKNCIKWREENNVEGVIDEVNTDPVLHELYASWPARTHKKDKRGMPVLYEKIGPADVRGLFTAFPESHHWIRNHILQHESTNKMIVEECPEVMKKPFQGIIFVEDLKGLGWQHWYTPAVSILKAVSNIDTEYYPLAVHKLYIINAPAVFTWMWKLVKPWLDPNTAASMNVLGEDFYDVLVKEIDPCNIPSEYGGKCECKNECLPKGGSYAASEDDSIVNAVVPPRDSLSVPFIVEKDSILKWEFKSITYDIGFGLFFELEDGTKKELIKSKRYDCHKQREEGTLSVPESGTYFFVWDNEYSKMRAKEISYKIYVDVPEAKDSEQ